MDNIINNITEGAILEGPYWQEPVRVLSVKSRSNRLEVHAIGVHSQQHSAKLISTEGFEAKVRISLPSERAEFNGNSIHFRLAAEAHRIKLAHQYDPHFAVSVFQVDPLPHQLDAVYSRLLTQPRIRLLIADDPGAGKTIMGGLLIKELKLRGLIERVQIVVSANLTDQWRRELHDKFGETFNVINRAAVNNAYGRNVCVFAFSALLILFWHLFENDKHSLLIIAGMYIATIIAELVFSKRRLFLRKGKSI